MRFGLLGGSIVDSNALLRSYIWHCIGIPLVASIFMAVHFWRIRKDGGISGPAPVMLESEMKAVDEEESELNTDVRSALAKQMDDPNGQYRWLAAAMTSAIIVTGLAPALEDLVGA